MQFGVSTHLYHGGRLGRDQLVEIAAHGFGWVEIFATRTHVDYHDAQVLSELAAHLSDAGLQAHSMHAPIADGLRNGTWGAPYSLAAADATSRALAVEEALAALRAASFLQASLLVVHLGVPAAQGDGRDNRRDAVLRSLETLHEAAGPLGVRLALEVIPNSLSAPDALVAVIEDGLEAGDVGICLDTGHAFLMGGVADAIEEASGHLVTTHLHDNRGTADDHLVPFDGAIDWAEAAMTLRKVGYEGAWMFELAATDEPRRVLGRAQAAQRRLERIFSV